MEEQLLFNETYINDPDDFYMPWRMTTRTEREIFFEIYNRLDWEQNIGLLKFVRPIG